MGSIEPLFVVLLAFGLILRGQTDRQVIVISFMMTEQVTTVAAISSAVVLLGAYLYSTSGPKSKNPFASDTRETSKPFENDKRKRDEVLKNGYTAKKFEDSLKDGKEYDAIFIGSGIGSLVAAAIMARAGKKVLVLEQHDQAGGCCHSFHEKGYEFDTGIHYIGEMRNNTAFRFLMDQLSNGHLGWSNVCDDFDTVVLVDEGENAGESLQRVENAVNKGEKLDARWIPFKSSKEDTIKSLTIAFPDEEVAIRKYFDMLDATRQRMRDFVALKAMPAWMGRCLVATGLINSYTDFFKFSAKSATETLKELTSNDALRAVLSYNFGDYGTIPKYAPFTMHAALQNHFVKGVSYPIGGSSEIGYHIIPTITRAGGRVFVRAEVDNIITTEDGAKATGVRMKKDGKIISAPIIVSNAGLYNTTQKLLPPTAAPRLGRMMKHVQHGSGGLSVYVGLKGTAEELGIAGKHYWAMWTKKGKEDLDFITEKYMNRSQATAANGVVPLLFISFPSAKDPLWSGKHPGKSTATIVTFANYDWFKEWENGRVMHRGVEYDTLKSAIGDIIWKQTVALFPQLKDKVEYFDVGSPVTNNYYLGAAGGEMYGCDHDLNRFTPEATVELRPETPIKNLYLTGQDVFNAGFAGASFGGVFCASAVLGRNVYEDLTMLKKKSPPSIPKK